ncbi:hypothetical protein SCANM63S_00817 [Streptomyces canarius]
MLRALPTTDGAELSSPENRGSRTDFGFQVAYADAPEAASRARASPPAARARRGRRYTARPRAVAPETTATQERTARSSVPWGAI